MSEKNCDDKFAHDKEIKKLNCLRKITELLQRGCKLDKNYDMNNSLEELEYVYEICLFNFNKLCMEHELIEIRKGFFLYNTHFDQNTCESLKICHLYVKLLTNGILKYIVENDEILWKQILSVTLHILKSGTIQKFIEIGCEHLKENICNYNNENTMSFTKSIITNTNQNTFLEFKKTVMSRNLKLIGSVKDDFEIEQTNRDEIIKLLLKINTIVMELKETSEELLEQFETICASNESLLNFVTEIKNFIVNNLDSVTKSDKFYYDHVVPVIIQYIKK